MESYLASGFEHTSYQLILLGTPSWRLHLAYSSTSANSGDRQIPDRGFD
ncbi:MAG: hypothetical protein ACM37W_18085 [Actinomycetota bacterium]